MIRPIFRTRRKNATSTSQSSAISCNFFNNVSFRLLSWLLLLLRMSTISAAKLDFELFKIKLRRRIFLLCIFQGNFTFGIEKESFEIHFLESVLAPSTPCLDRPVARVTIAMCKCGLSHRKATMTKQHVELHLSHPYGNDKTIWTVMKPYLFSTEGRISIERFGLHRSKD